MSDINSVVLVGRLTRDIEIKYTTSGMAIGKFSMAINKRVKKNDQWVDDVNFFDITVFGKIAESLQPYLTKGKQVGIQGELTQNRWEKDGQKFSKVEVIAQNIQLLGGGEKGQSKEADQNSSFGADHYKSKYGFKPENESSKPADIFSQTDDFEDDIPF